MKTIYKLLICFVLMLFFMSNSFAQITIVNAVAVDGDSNGNYGTVEFEFSETIEDDSLLASAQTGGDWEFSLSSDFSGSVNGNNGSTSVKVIVPTDNNADDVYYSITFDAELSGDEGPIYFRYNNGGKSVWNLALTDSLFDITNFVAEDKYPPTITDVDFSPTSGLKIVGETIAVIVTVGDSEIGLVGNSLGVNNSVVSNDSLVDNNDGTYTFNYIIQDGDDDIASNEQIPVAIELQDTFNNVSGTYTSSPSSGNCPTIDGNIPSVDTVETDVVGDWVKIGDIVTFTIKPDIAEDPLVISAPTYNSKALNPLWSTSNSGVSYTAQYTVVEGDDDQFSPLQLQNITLEDPNGQVSSPVNSDGIAWKIDATRPVDIEAGGVTITESVGGSVLKIGDQLTFTVDVVGSEYPLGVSQTTFNGQTLNWQTLDAGDTYFAVYTVQETDGNIASPINLTNVQVVDSAGNTCSNQESSLDLLKSIDSDIPVISGIVAETGVPGSVLMVGDTVDFVLNLSSGAEPGAEARINTVLFNGETLTWTTSDDIVFRSEYTVAEGNVELGSIQLTDVTLSDAAGNESVAVSSNTLSKSIDSDTPVINTVISDATGGGTLVVGETIIFTVDITTPDGSLTITPTNYNIKPLNWLTNDGGDSYIGTYTIAEGDVDQKASYLDLSGVVATDPAGNISNSENGTVTKYIDANTPVISGIVAETGVSGSVLIVGDTIDFVLTLSSGAEPGAEARINTVLFNGETLTWTTSDDIVFRSEYTVAEGNVELESIQLTDVTLSDAAGNESVAVSSNTLSKSIDSDTPVINTVISDATGGGTLVVGETITFTVDIAAPDGSLTITPANYNIKPLNWLTNDGGDSYIGTYTIAEGDVDQKASYLDLSSVVATDPAGNISNSMDGTVTKYIDANTPVISGIVAETGVPGSVLIVGDTIDFVFTLSSGAEPGAEARINIVLFNGETLTWTTSDDIVFRSEYTVVEGNVELESIQLTDVTLSDAAGNESVAVSSNTLSKSIDSDTPVINTVISDATGGGTLVVGETIIFTVDITTPDGSLTITPANYNIKPLNWLTNDGGDSYIGTYTIAEGDVDQKASYLDLSGVVATDPAGNISNSENGTVTKYIDANTPVISGIVAETGVPGSVLIVGDTIDFVLTLSSGAEPGAEARINTVLFNGETLTWTTSDDIVFRSEYTVAEGNVELGSIQLTDVTLSDAAGNESVAVSSNTLSKSIDSDTPVINNVTATTSVIASSLKVGDQVTFSLTLDAADEGISIVPTTYNSGTLNWNTSNGTVYSAIYTVEEGQGEPASIQITGVRVSDGAGNLSTIEVSNTILKGIDSNYPVISSVYLKDMSKKIGDEDTLYITINADTDFSNYTLESGTVAGYNISAIENFNSTTIYAFFDITEKTFNIDSSATIDVSNLQLADGAGNLSNTINSAVANNNHAIFSKKPTADINGSESICHQDSIEIPIFLNGHAPFSITYNDGVSAPVIINSISTSLYKLKIIANESIGSPLTYTLTDVTDATGNSNSGDGSFTLTINSLPTAIFTNPTSGNNFDISQDTVDLVGNFTPEGTFSGDGVLTATEQFSPSLAGLGFHDLNYAYEDVNGCKDSETISVEVIAGGNINFTQGKTIYCSYTDTFSVSGYNNFGNPGSFTLSGDPGGALINIAVDTAIIKPELLTAGNSYNITYSYSGGTSVVRSFSVEKVGSTITFVPIVDKCEDYETIFVDAKNLSPLGGTGNFILSDGGVNLHPTNNNNNIYIDLGDLIPTSYTLDYYYITTNGCSSDTTHDDFVVNPLPIVDITMDGLYDLNGGTRLINGTPSVPAGIFVPSFMIDNNNGTATFDPEIATIGDHKAFYTYTDLKGCTNIDSAEFTVNEAEAEIFGLDVFNSNNQYCYFNSEKDTIWATVPSSDGPGTFTIDGDVIAISVGVDSVEINPVNIGAGDHTLRFSYKDGLVDFYVEKSFNIDSIGKIEFTGLNPEYCEDLDKEILLTCNRDDGTNVFADLLGLTDNNDYDDLADFNPSKTNLGNNLISLTYTRTSSNCYKVYNQDVLINKTPYVDFDLDKLCVIDKTDSVLFTSDDSTLVSDNVVDWFWRVNNTVTILESNVDSSKFSLVPQFNNTAKLTLTTDKGCTSFIEKTIYIGSRVDLDFTWDNECDDKIVTFSVTEKTDTLGVDRVSWDFGDSFGTVIDTITNVYEPEFEFSDPGGYDVVYNEYTSTCGLITKSKKIFIRPSITIGANSYFEDFEQASEVTGWAVDLEISDSSSWEWGPPSGVKINSAAGGLNAFVTSLGGDYNNNEKSYVSSPCFDFTSMVKPMIEFDFISALEPTRDAVIMEYSIDKDVWESLGLYGQGVGWYNSFNLNNSILGQSSGWNANGISLNGDDPSSWNKAKYWLDEIAGEAGVRFRFVMGSDGFNVDEGFGFDNIWIGERNRLVLLEHFANTAEVDLENTQGIVENVAKANPQDVIPIQFFTSFPSTNEISNFYTAGPSARSLYYGISQVPYSVVDGGDRKFNYSSTNTLESSDIKRRMLKESKFEVKVKQGIDANNLNVKATITAIDSLEETKLSIRAVVVEKRVDSYLNVVRAMLPDPAGVQLTENWEINDSINLFQTWEIPTGVNVDSLITIVYIQKEDTKEIYQVGYTDIFSTVTSINDNFENILDVEYVVYPNPVNEILTVKLYKSVDYDLEINIYNSIGALIKSEKLYNGNSQKEININDLPAGVYYLKLGNTDKLFGTKKIIKTN